MLQALHIRNYILIDSLDVTFPEGLVIITGQTGAGKSILLGALSLLMGAKTDASVITEGSDNCVVEADFAVADSAVRSILEENDVEWENGHLTVRRVVYASGRSRSFINDSPVTLSVLSDISARLVDIHSQHQSLLLADRQFRLAMLDHYAGNTSLLADCSSAWKELQSLRNELASVTEKIAAMAAERDYNESRYLKLEQARLRDGEIEELEAEQRRLANAEEISNTLASVDSMFNPEDDSRMGLGAMLKESVRLLSRIEKYVDVAPFAERIEAARLDLADVSQELSDKLEAIELSPDRLETVESRLSLLYGLMKTYSCTDIAGLIATRDSLSELLFDAGALNEKKVALDARISEAEERYRSIASQLHDRRQAAAGAFASSIEDSIHFLELDRAVFELCLTESAPSASGADEVCFLFSANGRAPVDVAKCASGGELSRIMLCLKAMMAKFTSMPTMVFDEIDTGVSGSVADRMGTMICRMGASMQVFAITHLPQVAAKGSAHFLVSKDSGEKVTSTIKKLSPEERVIEIARMLSGSVITEEAVANARTLMSSI